MARVKSAVSIPVAVKVGPYFSSFAHMAGRLDRAGANALVLFNRFYQPDFDIETRTVAADAVVEQRPKRSACRCSGSPCCMDTCNAPWRQPRACTA